MSVSRLYAVSGFLPPLDRRSSRDAVAITLSVVFHLAAAVAVVRYGFLAIDAPAEKAEVVIKADMVRYVPPKTPPKTVPTTPVLSIRTPAPTPFTPSVVLDAIPNDEAPLTNAGPASLPETAPAPASESRGTAPPAPAATPPARPSVVTSPRWLRQPTVAQMQGAFPARAAEAGIGGRATINCKIVVGGGVTDCQIVTQSPSGEGFGPAAIQLSRYFLLDPRTENGQAVDGARVTIPLNFQPPAG